MVFGSAVFLFGFLPVVLCLYIAMPSLVLKNALLILASLLFYGFGEPVYVFLMIFSALFNYIIGLLAAKGGKTGRFGLAVGAAADIGCLCYFKYADFFLQNLNLVLGTEISLRNIALPIGISFFTFQEISYIADAYKTGKCQKNPFKILLYVSLFPQLIAGPIVKYGDIERELSDRRFSFDDASEGVCRFIFGLSKKLLIANTLGLMVDNILAFENMNILSAWFCALGYSLQLYFDFSGYSDMAIGLGRIFGFHFNENFNYPYIALSIKDFWNRWHISLSSWFRDYVYIPLGGNRKGRLRTNLNLAVVFLLTGFWHGASWNFVIWGIWHGFFRIAENIGIIKIKNNIIARVYTLVCVAVGFMIFRAENMRQAVYMVKNMFSGFDFSAAALADFVSVLSPYNIFIFFAAVVFCLPLFKRIEKFRFPLSAVLFVLCVLNIASAGYNPFIYFRF
ncbi:MAG: MBOAT family protein [Clostridiales bacterium]|nr:MBOAT family protein [Clostridiales bacterium]